MPTNQLLLQIPGQTNQYDLQDCPTGTKNTKNKKKGEWLLENDYCIIVKSIMNTQNAVHSFLIMFML